MRPDRGWRRSWCVACVSLRARRRRGARAGAGGWRSQGGLARGAGTLALTGLGQLHRPGLLLAGIDFEESGAVEAAREAIPGAADGELLFARAHEGLARPL